MPQISGGSFNNHGFVIPNEADAVSANQAEPDSVDFAQLAGAFGATGALSLANGTAEPSSFSLPRAYFISNTERNIEIFDGQYISMGNSLRVTGTTITLPALSGSNPRFDIIVADAFGIGTFRQGSESANPVFPALNRGDVPLAAVYVNAGSLTADHVVDKRIFYDVVAPVISEAIRDSDMVQPSRGKIIFSSDSQGMQVNVGSSAVPDWATFGGTIIGHSISGENMAFKANESADGAFTFYIDSSTGGWDFTIGNTESGFGTSQLIRNTAFLRENHTANATTGIFLSPWVEGKRTGIGFRNNMHRGLFGSNYYPNWSGTGSATDADDMGAIATHGRTDSSHQSASVGGVCHVSHYYPVDSWTSRTTLSGTLPAANPGDRGTIVLASTTNINYGDVLLLWESGKEPGRDNPTGNSTGTVLSGHEYVWVIPNSPLPADDPFQLNVWGWAGTIDASSGSVAVIRGWWQTKAYAHAATDRVWEVSRNVDGQFITAHYGPDSNGLREHRGGTTLTFGGVNATADWFNFGGAHLFGDAVGAAYESPFGGREGISGIESAPYASGGGGSSVLQAIGGGQASGGGTRHATAFRIVGQPGGHPTTLKGAIHYNWTSGEFEFARNVGWNTFLPIGTSLTSGYNAGAGTFLIDNIKTNAINPNATNGAVNLTTNLTFTDSNFSPLKTTGSIDISSAAGWVAKMYTMAPTILYRTAGNAFFGLQGFSNRPTIKNVGTIANHTAAGPIWGFVDNPTITFDTATSLSHSLYKSFWSYPTFNVTNGGQGTIGSDAFPLVNFAAEGSGSGIMIPRRIGLGISNYAMTGGTLQTQIGINIDQLTAGSTTNIGIINASPTVLTPSSSQAVSGSATVYSYNASILQLNVSTNMEYLGTPAAGQYGQIQLIRNIGNSRISLPHNSIRSTGMYLKDGHRTLMGDDWLLQVYAQNVESGALGWHEIAYSSNLNTIRKSPVMVPAPVLPLQSLTLTAVNLSDTTAYYGAVFLPTPILANQLLFIMPSTYSVTMNIALYNERGTRVLNLSRSVISLLSGNVGEISFTQIALQAGMYYIGCAVNGTSGTPQAYFWNTSDTWQSTPLSGEYILSGTGSVSGGVMPSTIDPTALTATGDRTLQFRLEGYLV